MDVSECLDSLRKAIQSIDVANCTCEGSNKERKVLNERSFAYELYRKWNETKPAGFVVNAEVTKTIEEKFEKQARELFGDHVKRFYPDMVLHHSQADSSLQAIICEIKTKDNINEENIVKDIKKLKAYTTENLILYHPFQLGVFIYVQGTIADINRKLLKGGIDNADNILFFCCQIDNDGKFEIKECSYNDILNNN